MNDLANLNNEPQLQSGLTVEASAITGTKVMNLQGEDLGHVEEVVIDAINGRVAYLVISIGGFMGMGETHYSVPWRALRYDQSLDAYILNVNKTQIEMNREFSATKLCFLPQPEETIEGLFLTKPEFSKEAPRLDHVPFKNVRLHSSENMIHMNAAYDRIYLRKFFDALVDPLNHLIRNDPKHAE